MGIGGKSGIFQAGPHPWAIENFAMVAKHPSAQIIAQDLFTFGAIKSAMDFQVYKEVAEHNVWLANKHVKKMRSEHRLGYEAIEDVEMLKRVWM
ncbi:Endoplasmic reticulum metallopeptidase 1 [Camellia lanceoleosa]|uniref:Endoplasmic reticulum metallopeptidase 1 n=1 Tax=Camellia lanceoleosa TaxID=1840588 RepID=A0ACC0HSC1_9ERIC|nr:Endoplasmic reticulum metallopeptidase 1 [Camellia lanceoleosa]